MQRCTTTLFTGGLSYFSQCVITLYNLVYPLLLFTRTQCLLGSRNLLHTGPQWLFSSSLSCKSKNCRAAGSIYLPLLLRGRECIVESPHRLERLPHPQKASLKVFEDPFSDTIALAIVAERSFWTVANQRRKKLHLMWNFDDGYPVQCRVAFDWPYGGSTWLLIDTSCPIHLPPQTSLSILINDTRSWILEGSPVSETRLSRKWTLYCIRCYFSNEKRHLHHFCIRCSISCI